MHENSVPLPVGNRAVAGIVGEGAPMGVPLPLCEVVVHLVIDKSSLALCECNLFQLADAFSAGSAFAAT